MSGSGFSFGSSRRAPSTPVYRTIHRFQVDQGRKGLRTCLVYRRPEGIRFRVRDYHTAPQALPGGVFVKALYLSDDIDDKFGWSDAGIQREPCITAISTKFGVRPLIGIPGSESASQGSYFPTAGLLFSSSNSAEGHPFSLIPHHLPLPHGGVVWGVLGRALDGELRYLGVVPRVFGSEAKILEALKVL